MNTGNEQQQNCYSNSRLTASSQARNFLLVLCCNKNVKYLLITCTKISIQTELKCNKKSIQTELNCNKNSIQTELNCNKMSTKTELTWWVRVPVSLAVACKLLIPCTDCWLSPTSSHSGRVHPGHVYKNNSFNNLKNPIFICYYTNEPKMYNINKMKLMSYLALSGCAPPN